jgi:PAS domain S-box-containing protein
MPDSTELLMALPAAVCVTDAEGRLTFYNDAAAELWGYRPELGTTRWCGSWRLYWPDGRQMAHEECPMAVALKEGRPVRGAEALAERPDGTRVSFVPYPTPLKGASGRVTGAINLLLDISDRNYSHLESARLAAIVTSSDDAMISKTIDGRITSWNAAATRMFGYEPDEAIGQPITLIIPPELHDEEKDIIARLRRGERIDHYETVRVARDGRRIELSLSVSPLRDKWGNVVGAAKVARDITERKRAEELQHLLLEELNHRVKNTLSTIQAMATQSLRHAAHPGAFVSAFTGRVQALARAHDLLTESKLQGADVMRLVREQVLLGSAADKRVKCSGPALMLDAQTALHLALVLHELATNARKYGALSVAQGLLSVTWEVRSNGGAELVLAWNESGGPRVSAPRARGFGSTLIERTLHAQGGKASMRYASEGLSARIRLPIAPASSRASGIAAALGEKAPQALLPQQPARKHDLTGKRILIIEDEALVLMDLEANLTDAGCVIAGTAGTLEEAKQLAAGASCDAALLDANLAGHPVDELALALSQRDIPFAFVTGYGRESLPNGFRDAMMLKKPFGHKDLLSVLDILLDNSPNVVALRRKSVADIAGSDR